MNLPVKDRGVEFHGDLVLLNKQVSLPDSSSGHACQAPVTRLGVRSHIPGTGCREGSVFAAHTWTIGIAASFVPNTRLNKKLAAVCTS